MLIEDIMALQRLVFEEKPDRKELLDYAPKCKKAFHVQVIRNHSFELIEHTIGAFLDYTGMGIEFSYTSYDDSMSFGDLNTDADLFVIWIDTTRYQDVELESFCETRIAALREITQRPILLVPFGCELHITKPDVLTFNLTKIAEEMGDAFTDERMSRFTGTSLSNRAMVSISKELGLRYLPAMLKPLLKAIIVDLDNTLYQGVIGEDGIKNVVLTAGHCALQRVLIDFSDSGFFLCAVSKNEQKDAETLFDQREDFPLKRKHFSKICASWDEKATAIHAIAEFLNIGTDSILFIDDNIGELAAVHAMLPDVHLLRAMPDGNETARVLRTYPGLMKISTSQEDALRKSDIQANEKRKTLQASMNGRDYVRSLKMRLIYSYNNPEQIQRIAELSNKTNQFIFTYQRYTQPEVEKMVLSDDYQVVTISLSDCLSDSGLIGVCVGKRTEDYVELEECFISCRALGRGIDDIIVMGAIRGMLTRFQCEKLRTSLQNGPRNLPARRFYEQYLERYASANVFAYEVPTDIVTIEEEDHKGA